jgi:rhamnose utilization protein RhaD (predicted bifunctional aldolase and dehydrogenase)
LRTGVKLKQLLSGYLLIRKKIMQSPQVLEQLIQLSHELARDDRDLAMLGEGNTSADNGDGTFWVKASGAEMATVDASGFSRVSLDAIKELMKRPQLSDQEVAEGLLAALMDKTHKKPSVETFLHAVSISEAGARWVCHTHAISVLKILCSQMGGEPFRRPLIPDMIVMCGTEPLIVPYLDPGFPLAAGVLRALREFQDRKGESPRIILMENHGVLSMGQTARQALNAMLMIDKWARILEGTYTFGGPKYLPEDVINRIETRPDEKYRRQRLA